MESLVAIAVFALGFVAVAAIFPVGATLQKGAAGDVLTQQVARNVEAMLQSRKFIHANLTAYNQILDEYGPHYIQEYFPNNDPNDPDYDPSVDEPNLSVQPVLKTTSPGNLLDPPGRFPGGIFERWMLNDRSYFLMRNNLNGANDYHPQHAAELGDPYADEFKRTFYWVPLIRRTKPNTGPSDWQVFVFILRRDAATYDRSSNSVATNAFSGVWANHDGFRSPNWYVPGVRSLAVTNVTDPDISSPPAYAYRFSLNNTWTGIGSGLEIVAGDLVLDSNGVRHTVFRAGPNFIDVKGAIPETPAQPDRIWYARPAAVGRPSPTRQILFLTDVVE